MTILGTATSDPSQGSVTARFAELSDKVNQYLQTFREFGIRSNRAVAQYLCIDGAELSRLKNARVGDINLQRGYEILRKCEELSKRLTTFGGPMKCKDVYSIGLNVSALPAVSRRELHHAIALQQQTDAALLTVDEGVQREELDMLLGDVFRSVVHPRRNPYGPMSIMYVLKSVYAAPSASVEQLLNAIHVVRLGRRACSKEAFNGEFGDDIRLRYLAGILNNGGGIALRIAKEHPPIRRRMLRLSRFLHKQSLETYYFAGTLRGALTCANDLEDTDSAKELLQLLVDAEGPDRARWPRGIVADLDDSVEWRFLKKNEFWNLIDLADETAGADPRYLQPAREGVA